MLGLKLNHVSKRGYWRGFYSYSTNYTGSIIQGEGSGKQANILMDTKDKTTGIMLSNDARNI